jgi:DNA helicase-2/ATP-dependent DNA helicase PcrA
VKPGVDPLEGLNPEQRAAVLHERGPLLVLAGAGSGKTRVVTRRLARLIREGADPRRVIAVTFTNKAAEEMRSRVREFLEAPVAEPFVGTFHAWGLRFLRRRAAAAGLSVGFAVADTADQLLLVRAAMTETEVSEQAFSPASIQARISSAKGALLSVRRFAEGEGEAGSRIARVYELYEKKLRQAGAVDFDDLILLPVRALKESGELLAAERRFVEHLLVDEYQDTNRAQDALIRLLGAEAVSLCAVGDEDQSIYGWRGARVDHILRFEEDFPGASVVALTRNYRSTGKILQAAGGLVSRNRRRRAKKLVSQGEEGVPVGVRTFRDDRSEAEWIVSRIAERTRSYGEQAVLFRVNAQSRTFEDELVRKGIPYVVVGGLKFYERSEVKDAVAYLRLTLDPADDLAFRRIVNVPARGIGAATLDTIAAFAREKGIPLLQATGAVEGIGERAKIALLRFREILEAGARKAAEASPSALLEFLLNESGYGALYAHSAEREDLARSENLRELVSAAREYEGREGSGASVRGFVDAVALAGDGDAVRGAGAVALMTLHSAKGLEFSEVFVAGLEEGFLPHSQSAASDEEVEEERRLLYVGMTRARERLTLTHARRRLVYGETRMRQPSRFLDDLPSGAIETVEEGEPATSLFSASDASAFDHSGWRGRRETTPPISVPRRRAPIPGTLPGLGRGQRVRHARYGLGVVMQQEGTGEEARVTVFFDRAGKKKFIAKFANLTPA